MKQQVTIKSDAARGAIPVADGLLRRKCACGKNTAGGGECGTCERKRTPVIQRAGGNSRTGTVPPAVHKALRSPGRPLDAATRAFMEPRFGHDFSRVSVGAQSKLSVGQPGDRYEQEADRLAERVVSGSSLPRRDHTAPAGGAAGVVEDAGKPGGGHVVDFARVRVHTDELAGEAVRSVGARAFTLGHDIFFAPGQYAPQAAGGQLLLAHELAHVGQQGGAASLVQRSITVQDPGAQTPNIPIPFVSMTNAQIVQSWLTQLCPTGGWTVDGASGAVSSPNRDTFCAARPPRGPVNRFSTSGAPTSCGCLCQLTATGSRPIRVHAANAFTVGGTRFDVTGAGEGITVYPHAGVPEHHVGVTGRDLRPVAGVTAGIPGVGDTSPEAGANPNQTIRDPPWIIFAHEVCGHARLQTAPTDIEHTPTPEGDRSAVDVENRVRREHSTTTNSFGIRRGEFVDSTGRGHDGSVYRVSAGETLSGIARRTGLSAAQITTDIFRENGDPVTAATQNRVRVNERLMIVGIFWHEVIRGETMTAIATMWGVPLASLIRANPQVPDPNHIRPGQMLLIPAS